MAISVALLRLIAERYPYLWEIIGPHGPALRVQVSAAAEVELNPQPIPPGRVQLAAAAALASELARLAVLTHAQGGAGGELVERMVDEWCGTKGPRPWPPGWPHLLGDAAEPDPHPWDVAGMFLAAALVFAGHAAAITDPSLSGALDKAADLAASRAVAANEG